MLTVLDFPTHFAHANFPWGIYCQSVSLPRIECMLGKIHQSLYYFTNVTCIFQMLMNAVHLWVRSRNKVRRPWFTARTQNITLLICQINALGRMLIATVKSSSITQPRVDYAKPLNSYSFCFCYQTQSTEDAEETISVPILRRVVNHVSLIYSPIDIHPN